MSTTTNKIEWWISGVILIFTIALFMIANQIRVLGNDLQEELAGLHGDVLELQVSIAGKSQGDTPWAAELSQQLDGMDPVPKIEALGRKITAIAQILTEMQKTCTTPSPSTRSTSEVSEALFPPLDRNTNMPLDGDGQAAPSLSPDSMDTWLQSASPEKQKIFEQIMNEQAKIAQEKIEAEAEDPDNPDMELLMRVMEETDAEINAQLREQLPQEDVDVLLQAGQPFSSAPDL